MVLINFVTVTKKYDHWGDLNCLFGHNSKFLRENQVNDYSEYANILWTPTAFTYYEYTTSEPSSKICLICTTSWEGYINAETKYFKGFIYPSNLVPGFAHECKNAPICPESIYDCETMFILIMSY